MSAPTKFIREILQDYAGQFSSKRAIVFFAFILMAIAFVSNLYWGFTIAEFMFDAMLYIVIGGLSLTVGEQVTTVWKSRIEAKNAVDAQKVE